MLKFGCLIDMDEYDKMKDNREEESFNKLLHVC